MTQEWCRRRAWADGDAVREEKLVAWLQQEVLLERVPIRKGKIPQSKKRKRSEEEIAEIEARELAEQLGVDLYELPAMLAADKGEDLVEEVVVGEFGELAGTFFTPATIDCYVAAMVELWQTQVSTPFPADYSNRQLVSVLKP